MQAATEYKSIQVVSFEVPVWHGSVLIVAKIGSDRPSLKLECLRVQTSAPNHHKHVMRASLLTLDSVQAFWRFAIHLLFRTPNHAGSTR